MAATTTIAPSYTDALQAATAGARAARRTQYVYAQGAAWAVAGVAPLEGGYTRVMADGAVLQVPDAAVEAYQRWARLVSAGATQEA